MSSSSIISSLPPVISGDGLFTVQNVVPTTTSGLFAPGEGDISSNSYSYPLMNPAAIVGTETQPYMNIALPAYISTLYDNVYKINTNLKNSISTAAINNREYPTSYAVQQYVQEQIAGTQIINGQTGNNTYTVNTTMTNTIINTANTAALGFSYSKSGHAGIKTIAMYWMDTSANAPRNGATKTVMFSADNYLKDAEGNITHNLAFLYAGDSSNFLNLGQTYKYYQFVARGDFLDFIQNYNSSTNSWEWMVKDSLGNFSNTVNVGSAISDYNESMPTPASGITVST